MPYGLLDDGLHCHPKHLAVSLAADGLWMRTLSWARGQPNGAGIIPEGVARLHAGRATARLAAELVNTRLWDKLEIGGWAIHGYAKQYDEADAKRAAISEARSEFGRLGAARRWHKPSEGDGISHSKPMANAWQTDAPGTSTKVKGVSNETPCDLPMAKAMPRRRSEGTTPHRYSEEADELSKELWEVLSPKPVAGFVPFRERISEVLLAGHPAEALRRVAPYVATWTRASIELELNRGRPHPQSNRELDALDAMIRREEAAAQ